MKKALALVLALLLVFTLFACNTKTEEPDAGGSDAGASDAVSTEPEAADSVAPPTGDGSSPYPNANEDGSINLDTIASYDQNYDYSKNPTYKFAYLSQSGSALYAMSADAFEYWAPLFNMEWAGFHSSNGDNDLYMTMLQNLIDQGVTGFVLDPDSTIMPAISDVLDANPEVQWMTFMAPPRDHSEGEGVPVGGNLIHPHVGFSYYDCGMMLTEKLLEWKDATYPDVSLDDIAMLSFTYSVVPELDDRHVGAKDAWLAAGGSEDNYFVVDCLSTGLDIQGGLDACSPVISTETDYEYWLINGNIDDWAIAAASVLDQQGLTETSCVVTMGGSGAITQWDSGQFDSLHYAFFTAQTLYGEPVIGAVYAFLNGWATPETVWPSWIKLDDHGAGDVNYAQYRVPIVWLAEDDYKGYLEWTDLYTKANAYDYSTEGVGIDDYTPYAEIPEGYSGYTG